MATGYSVPFSTPPITSSVFPSTMTISETSFIPLTYTKRDEKGLSHTVTHHRFCVHPFPTGVRCWGQCVLYPMVRHTVSGHFTPLRDHDLCKVFFYYCILYGLNLYFQVLQSMINIRKHRRDNPPTHVDSRCHHGRCYGNARRHMRDTDVTNGDVPLSS